MVSTRSLLILGLGLFVFATAGFGQAPDSPEQPKSDKEAPADATPKKTPDLHKIYVPYEKLEELLGTDKERVLVPYKEFLELWKLKYGPNSTPDRPPVPFAVDAARYEGRVQNGIASFTATIEIEVFGDGWHRVPLGFSKVAFEEVLVDGKPGVLTPGKSGYHLIMRGRGRHTIKARFVAGVVKGKEFATSAFSLPSAPLSRMTFRVPGKGTEISLKPARAHSTTDDGDDTLLLAFLGPQSSVQLRWRYQPEVVDTEPPLLFATQSQRIHVEERVLRGSAEFQLRILRTAAGTFRFTIPQGAQVLEVEGAKIRTWSFEGDKRETLRVVLHQPVLGNYTLRIGYERALTVPGALALPPFRLANASGESGFVRVESAEGVGVRTSTLENVFQEDLSALPKSLQGKGRALGFRFPSTPYSLGLLTERIQPLTTLKSRTRVTVERRTYALDAALTFTVERAGLFSLLIEIPDGIKLTDIGTPALVDSYRERTEDGKQLLEIDLKGRKIGTFVLPLRGEAELDLAQGELTAPLVRVRNIDRQEGTIGVYMDPAIKAAATTKNVIPLEPAKLQREDRFAASQPLTFAWRYRGDGASVEFKVESRKPKVTCDVRYSLQADEARVRVRADLVYNVQFSGVEKFQFRVPKSIVETLKVTGKNVREKPHADDAVVEGKQPTTTYTVTLQGPTLGEVVLTAEYDAVFPAALRVNENRRVAIPAVFPLEIERGNTYVAVRKSPVIKVDGGSTDYEQIDAAELPASIAGDDVFLALRRFDKPTAFPVDLTKHEYQPVADLVVRHTHLKTVLTGEDRATTTAFFEVLNNDRQFLALRLPEGHEVLELRVADKPEKPRIGKEGVLLVPLLTGLRKDATFRVAVAYTHPVDNGNAVSRRVRLVGPRLPAIEDQSAPVQALLTWSVHHPSDWQVRHYGGNVTPAGADAEIGSWLHVAIRTLGNLVKPTARATPQRDGRRLAKANFQDIVPMFRERASVEALFTNGTGDAELEIAYATTTAHVVHILLALLAAAAAVIILARSFPLWRVAGLITLGVLIVLAFVTRSWVPIWNGALAGAVGTALVLAIGRRVNRSKA